MSSYFPDLNVLLALTLSKHGLKAAAQRWYDREGKPTLQVCQHVRLGYLRLLTTEAVSTTAVRSNAEAWEFVDDLVRAGYISMIGEPLRIDHLWQSRGTLPTASPKRWADAYLSSFAETAGLSLVTFDAALASYTPRSVLLRE